MKELILTAQVATVQVKRMSGGRLHGVTASLITPIGRGGKV